MFSMIMIRKVSAIRKKMSGTVNWLGWCRKHSRVKGRIQMKLLPDSLFVGSSGTRLPNIAVIISVTISGID